MNKTGVMDSKFPTKEYVGQEKPPAAALARVEVDSSLKSPSAATLLGGTIALVLGKWRIGYQHGFEMEILEMQVRAGISMLVEPVLPVEEEAATRRNSSKRSLAFCS